MYERAKIAEKYFNQHYKGKTVKITAIPTTLRKLYSCYDKPSQAKQEIYQDCVDIATSFNWIQYGIISYNVFVFTFGFMFYYCDKAYWCVITKSGEQIFEVIY